MKPILRKVSQDPWGMCSEAVRFWLGDLTFDSFDPTFPASHKYELYAMRIWYPLSSMQGIITFFFNLKAAKCSYTVPYIDNMEYEVKFWWIVSCQKKRVLLFEILMYRSLNQPVWHLITSTFWLKRTPASVGPALGAKNPSPWIAWRIAGYELWQLPLGPPLGSESHCRFVGAHVLCRWFSCSVVPGTNGSGWVRIPKILH